MIAAAIAQLRLAVSLVTGRPIPSWAFDRLIAAGLDTVREFGHIEPDGEATLNGPVLDDTTRREVQLRRFRAQAQRAVNGTDFYGPRFAMTRRRTLRAEVDHVQTGAIYVGRDVPESWILENMQVATSLKREPLIDGNAENDISAHPEN